MNMHNNGRTKLADILSAEQLAELQAAWETTAAAADRKPLPAGEYLCHLADLSAFRARSGTPGLKLRFDVLDGQHRGHSVWHDLWLTSAALPMTKRDLQRLGVTDMTALETLRLPANGRMRCKVRVGLRLSNDNVPYNVVRDFEVVGIDSADDADPFAPSDQAGGDGVAGGADAETEIPF